LGKKSLGYLRAAGGRPLAAGWSVTNRRRAATKSRGPKARRQPTVARWPWPIVRQTASCPPFWHFFHSFLYYEDGHGIGRMGV
jgi:hypothetical protein